MQNLTAFIKSIKNYTPELLLERKNSLYSKKRKLEKKRQDIQAQIDGLAIQIDAIYTVEAGFDLPSIKDYKQRIHVTDHVLIRYIERVLKLDLEALRKELLDSMPQTITRNAQTVIHDNTIYRLTWEQNHITLLTLYKRSTKRLKNLKEFL